MSLFSSCPRKALRSWRSFGRGMEAIWAMWEQFLRKLGKPQAVLQGSVSHVCCSLSLLHWHQGTSFFTERDKLPSQTAIARPVQEGSPRGDSERSGLRSGTMFSWAYVPAH